MKEDSKSKRIGLYITVIFHVTVIAVLMGISLKNTIDRTDEIILDLLSEKEMKEFQELEEQLKQQELNEKGEEALREAQLAEIHNMVIDESSGALKDDRGTDADDLYKQHEELMKELEEVRQMDTGETDDEISMPEDTKQEEEAKILPNEIETGLATIRFSVDGRHPTRYRIPAYKCENAGMVVVKILVSPNGQVVHAEVIEDQSDPDKCNHEAALRAAKESRFNASTTAPAKVPGTITFIFFPQN